MFVFCVQKLLNFDIFSSTLALIQSINNDSSWYELLPEFSKSYLSGNFTISLDLFPDQRYVSAYTAKDFPVNVVIRKRLYFQVNVKSSDKDLSVLAQDCYGTPTQNQNDRMKFFFIQNG
jgi:hypothetical protein